MKIIVSVLATVITLLAVSHAAAQICGDVNDDMSYNIGDAVYLASYLFGGGPEPPRYLYADADGYQVLTLNDMIVIMTHRTPTCPPAQRKFSGPPNNGYKLFLYSDVWPAGVTSQNIKIQINTTTPFIYTVLPLLIHVGSELPEVVLSTPDPEFADWSDAGTPGISAGPGRLLLEFADTAYAPIGPFDTLAYPDGQRVATVQLSLASAPTSDQTIRLGWDMNCPPVNATYGSSHYPVLLVSWSRGYPLAYTPALPGQKVPSLSLWGAVALVMALLLTGIWLYARKRRLSRVTG